MLLQEIAAELADLQNQKLSIEDAAQSAIRTSGINEEILEHETQLNSAKNRLNAFASQFAVELVPINNRISELKEALVANWAVTDGVNKKIKTPFGTIKIRTTSSVEIYKNGELLQELCLRHTNEEVSSYITSFRKTAVRKFLGLFTINPEIAEIEVFHEAELILPEEHP